MSDPRVYWNTRGNTASFYDGGNFTGEMLPLLTDVTSRDELQRQLEEHGRYVLGDEPGAAVPGTEPDIWHNEGGNILSMRLSRAENCPNLSLPRHKLGVDPMHCEPCHDASRGKR